VIADVPSAQLAASSRRTRSMRAACVRSMLVGAMAVGGLFASGEATAADRDLRSPLIGHAAPDFTMRALSGGNLRLSEHRGDVVLVGFWTSWCGTCRAYLERLNRLHATYGTAGLVVVGVSLDDDARRAASLADAVGAKFPNVFDGRKDLGPTWRVGDVPMTVLVDRAGVVRHVYGELQRRDDADLVVEIRKLLDE
jgi:peroxiredoxin